MTRRCPVQEQFHAGVKLRRAAFISLKTQGRLTADLAQTHEFREDLHPLFSVVTVGSLHQLFL